MTTCPLPEITEKDPHADDSLRKGKDSPIWPPEPTSFLYNPYVTPTITFLVH